MSLSALSHWRNRGPIDTTPKKLRMGLVPSGTNNYTWPSFFYDEAKRAWWTLASSNGPPIYPLDFPYAYDPSTVFPNGFSAPKGWNTTLDGSTVNSSELGLAVAPVERASIKMDNDGWIDLSTLPSGTTRICLILPGVFSKARAGNTFQVRFASPVLSAVLDGTGAVANSWQSEDGNAGYNYRFTLAGQSAALSIRIEVANVPGGKIKRPKIVPHPGGNGVTRSPNAYTPEPVGEPQELGRIMHACRHIRTLDMMRINGRKISGDSFTALRLRDTEPTDYLFGSDTNGLDHPCCSMAEMVAIANENNAGLHVNFGHRDSDALLQQHGSGPAGTYYTTGSVVDPRTHKRVHVAMAKFPVDRGFAMSGDVFIGRQRRAMTPGLGRHPVDFFTALNNNGYATGNTAYPGFMTRLTGKRGPYTLMRACTGQP